MSGCYLCKYTQGGQQHLAHIGTVNNQSSPESIAAKAAWRTFVALPGVSMVTGGSPADYYDFAEFQAAQVRTGGIPFVVGYFAAGAAYAMLLAPVPANLNSRGRALLKVAVIKTMTMQPWSSIAAMRRFQD
jgi:hypothetical protein